MLRGRNHRLKWGGRCQVGLREAPQTISPRIYGSGTVLALRLPGAGTTITEGTVRACTGAAGTTITIDQLAEVGRWPCDLIHLVDDRQAHQIEIELQPSEQADETL